MEKVGCCFFKVRRGNKKQKEKKRALMFTKISAEKLSETACQSLEKKKKEKE